MTGQINIKGDLLKQMESLAVAGVIHLVDASNLRQYFVIRLPDQIEKSPAPGGTGLSTEVE